MDNRFRLAGNLSAGLSLIALMALSLPASAQQCQSVLQGKRFTLIVPYGPGGGYDGYARLYASQFEASTGSTMRIRFMPGAGSMIGISAVAEAGPTDLVLGLFNANILFNEWILGRDSTGVDSLVFLGSMISDASVWATRKDVQVDFSSPEPRLFAMASSTDFSRVLLPGYALGWDINLVRGYSGSTEGLLALLRGDVDYYYNTSVMMANRIQSLDDLAPLISLTDGPNPVLPEVVYLAGAGGIVGQLFSELNPDEQRQRQEIASLAAELSMTHRALSISSRVDPGILACLSAAVDTTLFSDDLRAAADMQQLIIEPKNRATFQLEIERTSKLIESHWELLQDLVALTR